MREVVHGVDAPGVAGPMVGGAPDPVERRIPHVEIRRSHVDLGAQDVLTVLELSGAHAREQVEAFPGRPIAPWTVPAGFGERAPVLTDLIGGELVDVGEILA